MSENRQANGPKPMRGYREILIREIVQGLAELRRPAGGLALSGISAGLELGFSVFLMGVIATLLEPATPEILHRVLLASAYSVGFIFVVLGRSELFTEHTALAVFPVLGKRATVPSLLRLWGIVFVANLAGALLFAAITVVVGPAMDTVEASAFGEIARPLIGHEWSVTLAGAILAGWLMGLLAWLVVAARETISQLVVVFLVTFTIGALQLPHAIAGTIEVAVAVFAGEGASAGQLLRFVVLATLGNSIGGVFFVAAIKFGHSVRSVDEDEEEEVTIESPGGRPTPAAPAPSR